MLGVINVPVTDLRREPSQHPGGYERDFGQESQLILGEKVLVHKEEGDWAFIEAVEQRKWYENAWGGYKGWIQKGHMTRGGETEEADCLIDAFWQPVHEKPDHFSQVVQVAPMGASFICLDALPEWWVIKMPDNKTAFVPKKGMVRLSEARKRGAQELIERGRRFENAPYLWGGRSPYLAGGMGGITSVDCSGLTNLLYRLHGIEIPRDAHDQFLKCKAVNFDELVEGDLVFTADVKKPLRMNHVMLFAGNDLLLEASMGPKCVRFVKVEDKLGKKLSGVRSGETVGESVVHFGKVV